MAHVDTKQSQAEKMAWIKAVGADTQLSHATRLVAVMAAVNLAFAKGRFRASYPMLAKISGVSIRSAYRAVDELCAHGYLDVVSFAIGRTSEYMIISLEERAEEMRQAEEEDRLAAKRRADTEQKRISDFCTRTFNRLTVAGHTEDVAVAATEAACAQFLAGASETEVDDAIAAVLVEKGAAHGHHGNREGEITQSPGQFPTPATVAGDPCQGDTGPLPR
ncbi:helix-turn-helix domain-containing protein [Mycolicibacterium porcinum]|uniref:Helix-turn-helix domain-containing protein n=1 Tax=Mycolicibacterium porcinum TaxID=39693 RepID=A0ABV3VK83_9MYCO